jgi:hypothetical protein
MQYGRIFDNRGSRYPSQSSNSLNITHCLCLPLLGKLSYHFLRLIFLGMGLYMCIKTILSSCNLVHSCNNYNSQTRMNLQELTINPTKNIIENITRNGHCHPKDNTFHRQLLSDPKNKLNFIKISRNRLPNDFFQKKGSRRVSEQKLLYAQQFTEPLLHTRRI